MTAGHGRPPHAETRALAEHVASLAVDDLPADVVAKARAVVADSIACGVAGAVLAPEISGPIRRYALATGAPGPATLLDGGASLAFPVAALANATTMHTIDYDDTLMPAIAHFGASVTGAALAAVQESGGSGADLVAAVVAGFEVGGKVGRACMPGHYDRWHSTASLGGLAAAAAAARGLGLDGAETDVAIGFAADDAGGTRYCIKVGDFSKSLHAGSAAWKGSQGASLARLGALGPTGLLEHPYGFFWAYSDEREPGRLGPEVATIGQRWEILDDDLKAHPCILAAHSPIEAALDVMRAHDLDAGDVDAVHVRMPWFSNNHGLNYDPDSAMAARLSIPYCVAVAIEDDAVGLAQFAPGRLEQSSTRELLRRVEVEADRSLNARYPNVPVGLVEVVTRGGERFHAEVLEPRGSHRRPLTDDQHRAKLEELLGVALGTDAVAASLEAFARLEELDRVDGLLAGLTDKERTSP